MFAACFRQRNLPPRTLVSAFFPMVGPSGLPVELVQMAVKLAAKGGEVEDLKALRSTCSEFRKIVRSTVGYDGRPVFVLEFVVSKPVNKSLDLIVTALKAFRLHPAKDMPPIRVVVSPRGDSWGAGPLRRLSALMKALRPLTFCLMGFHLVLLDPRSYASIPLTLFKQDVSELRDLEIEILRGDEGPDFLKLCEAIESGWLAQDLPNIRSLWLGGVYLPLTPVFDYLHTGEFDLDVDMLSTFLVELATGCPSLACLKLVIFGSGLASTPELKFDQQTLAMISRLTRLELQTEDVDRMAIMHLCSAFRGPMLRLQLCDAEAGLPDFWPKEPNMSVVISRVAEHLPIEVTMSSSGRSYAWESDVPAEVNVFTPFRVLGINIGFLSFALHHELDDALVWTDLPNLQRLALWVKTLDRPIKPFYAPRLDRIDFEAAEWDPQRHCLCGLITPSVCNFLRALRPAETPGVCRIVVGKNVTISDELRKSLQTLFIFS